MVAWTCSTCNEQKATVMPMRKVTLVQVAYQYRRQTHLLCQLWLDGASVADVALHLWHGVGHIEGTLTPLVHAHNVSRNLVIVDLIRLIKHHMQEVKPAAAVRNRHTVSTTVLSSSPSTQQLQAEAV